jgi:hypothetical protein
MDFGGKAAARAPMAWSRLAFFTSARTVLCALTGRVDHRVFLIKVIPQSLEKTFSKRCFSPSARNAYEFF